MTNRVNLKGADEGILAEKPKIVLVDDNESVRKLFARVLAGDNVEVLSADSVRRAREVIESSSVDLVFLDLVLPDGNGMDLLYQLRDTRPEVPVVLITGHGTIELAVEAMKTGAFDFLRKPLEHVELLRIIVSRALDRKRVMAENRDLRRELDSRYRLDRLVSRSESMQKIFGVVEQISGIEPAVLIQGESGTGKELLARAIHYNSPRKDGKFVPIDCAGLPETLIESELFGHVKGAFTGACRDHEGLFREAGVGTVFLDEIGELGLSVQSKLLRVLQEREVRPVGSNESFPVNARVIAATHRDLPAEVKAGRFREDLYYRINVVCLEIPPLRERSEDIPLLVEDALRRRGGGGAERSFSPAALQALTGHDWPGNVRELMNTVEQVLALTESREVSSKELPAFSDNVRQKPDKEDPPLSLAAYEKRAIERAIEECGHDVVRAAAVLEVGLSTMYRKMKKHGIPPSRKSRPKGSAGKSGLV